MHYVMENMGKIRAALTAEKGDDFKQRDIMSKLGEGWQSMNDDAKAPYAAKAAAAKEHYSIEIEVRCCMCRLLRLPHAPSRPRTISPAHQSHFPLSCTGLL
jgi:hypothetical protein